MSRLKISGLLWTFLFIPAGLALPQPVQPTLSVQAVSPVAALAPGKTVDIVLELRIAAGYHINSDQPLDEKAIPTKVTFKPEPGLKVGPAVFPLPEMKAFSFSSEPLAVFQGTIKVQVPVTVAKVFKGKEAVIEGVVSYQACDDNSCYAPEDAAFKAVVPVSAGAATAAAQNKEAIVEKRAPGGEVEPRAELPAEPGRPAKDVSGQKEVLREPRRADEAEDELAPLKVVGGELKEAPKAAPAEPSASADGPEDLAKTVRERGLPLTFLLIFLGGLALNLTPCVYPLIPITIGYFGGQAGGKKGSLLVHALFYVLGMAVTYSVLGSIAAFTGGLFGAALQIPAVLMAIAAVMIALALSMFDLYEFRLPGFLNKMAGASRKGFFGTLFMGLTVGVVAAPCIGPFVLGLLTYVADRGSVLLGFWMFFVLALGLGLPFMVLAVFSGSVNRLPHAGAWMVWVRKIFGFVLLAMALYFLRPLFPGPLFYGLAMAMLLLVAGIYLAWVEPTRSEGKAFPLIRNMVGIAFFIVALLFAQAAIQDSIDRRIAELAPRPAEASRLGPILWQPYEEAIIRQAAKEGRRVFIDFYADWCIPCHELDAKTFSDPEVAALSRQFLMVKADMTSAVSPQTRRLRRRYGIPGVPTLIFLGPDGRERPDLRVFGYINKKEFLERMNRALSDRPPAD